MGEGDQPNPTLNNPVSIKKAVLGLLHDLYKKRKSLSTQYKFPEKRSVSLSQIILQPIMINQQ
jgi:hypothetical protein